MTYPNPFTQFQEWLKKAEDLGIPYPNAMTVSTLDENGWPDSRILLLKECDEDGFVFFTNKQSVKGHQLNNCPRAALVFYWKELGLQVRVQGTVEDTSDDESDAYFATRPRLSQIGAWASLQSSPLNDRPFLEKRVEEFEARFHGKPVARPPYWGGYRLIPHKIEFWTEQPFRLHDRLIYKLEEGEWGVTRVYP
jgi:pyridoxamine 5'-phosphate oxidase